ncbi:MAG TPA: DUF4974 domain-containing protein [Pirellulales bacterium]|nr:DUF4974 domain-containing protein [Pirellulales bacterium]
MSKLQHSAWLIALAALSSAIAPLRGAESSLPPPNPNEAKILAALDDKTELEFVDQPLNDVIEYLKSRHEIEIQLDNKALADAGLGSDTPVTKNIKGISLESALDLILGELDLTYTVRDEVLLITTKTAAKSMLSAKIYPVADLVATPVGDDYQNLIEMITSSVDPSAWDEVGGPGCITEFRNAHALVIDQTSTVHRQIERLLAAVRDARRAQAAEEPKQAEDEVKDDETLYVQVYRLPAAWMHPPRRGMGGGAGRAPSSAPRQAPATSTAPAKDKPGDKPAPKNVHPQMGMGGGGMGGAASSSRSVSMADQLAAAIPGVIAPENWDVSGGAGAIRAVGDTLIVRQTRPVHREIRQLLEQLQ